MGFRLPIGARDYYTAIDKRTDGGIKLKMLFDIYYLCLMLGLNQAKLGSGDQLESDEFLKEIYPDTYADYGLLLAALLIDAELRRQDIKPEDKRRTENLIINNIDPSSYTKINSNGIDLLNLYAVTGMEIIRDEIAKTSDLEVFLQQYMKLLNPDIN